MNPIPKAGAIMMRPGVNEPEILLLFRGRHDDWSFPKGHCEAGESFEETAVREIQEETGLSIKILRQLPSMEYKDGKSQNVMAAMYLGTPLDKNQKEKPEHEWDRVEWIPLSKIETTLSYPNLKEYFRQVTSYLSL